MGSGGYYIDNYIEKKKAEGSEKAIVKKKGSTFIVDKRLVILEVVLAQMKVQPIIFNWLIQKIAKIVAVCDMVKFGVGNRILTQSFEIQSIKMIK
jgi:hypothetical protein